MKDPLFRIFFALYLFRVTASIILFFVFQSAFFLREFLTSTMWLAGELCLLYLVFSLLRKLPFQFASVALLFLVTIIMSMWTIADPIVVALAGDHLTPSLLAHFAGFQIFLSDELWLPIKEHAFLVIAGVVGLLAVLITAFYFSRKAILQQGEFSSKRLLFTFLVSMVFLFLPLLIEGRFLIYPPEVTFIRNYLRWDQIKPSQEHFANLYDLVLDENEQLIDENYPLEVITTSDRSPSRLNVIMIVIESLRAVEYQTFNPNANFRMKSFELFANKGIVYPYMVSNGFPSVEGFSALTMGIWPHSKDRIIVSHQDKIMPSLAMALKSNGYLTYALEDRHDPEEEGFWIRKTFDRHYTYEDQGKFASAKVMFDELRGIVNEYDSTQQPFFVHLKTRNPHYPYQIADDSLKQFYTIGSPAENYFASMKVIDKHLVDLYQFFFEHGIFENSLVIITGDHANYLDKLHTTSLPTDETVWIGAIFAGPETLFPRGEKNYDHASQVDIHATVHDLFTHNVPRLLLGRTLFAPDLEKKQAVSVRPAGVRLDINHQSYTLDRNHPTQYLSIPSFCIAPTSKRSPVSESELLNIVDTWSYLVNENKVFNPETYEIPSSAQ